MIRRLTGRHTKPEEIALSAANVFWFVEDLVIAIGYRLVAAGHLIGKAGHLILDTYARFEERRP